VALEVILHRLAFDPRRRSEVVSAEEEREHRPCGELGFVCRPDHPRQRLLAVRMQNRRVGFMQMRNIQTDCFQRPARRAISAGKPAEYILMRIDEKVKAVAARFFHHHPDVLDILLVV
jgi:hypothetical protein